MPCFPTSTVPLFDTHCHCGLVLNAHPPPQPGCYELIASVELRHWHTLPPLLEGKSQRLGALGLHPWFAQQWEPSCAARLEELLQQPEIVAVGEVGLDPGVGAALEVQERVLRAQIHLALKMKKPLILHVTKGYPRMLEILREEQAQQVGGVVHAFSAGANVGNDFIRQGFHLGVGPLLLQPHARKLPTALCSLPLDRLVLETDAQGGMDGYTTPTQRTKVLSAIAQRLAEIHAETPARICQQLWHNSRKLFLLPEPIPQREELS
ncbi:MAG: TatD family hydrolase [Desulfuromonadaceae bacterium]|nr:TatD family hydrolase [Desulfuromonadaceae bacterium]